MNVETMKLCRNLCTFCGICWQYGIYFQASAWRKDVRNIWRYWSESLHCTGWCTVVVMFFLNLKYLLIYGVIVKLTIMSFLILSKTSVVIAYYTGSICLYIFVAFISIFLLSS